MAADSFGNIGASGIVLELVKAIQENRNYLSDIDGLIGDGDHGINMSKGFTMAGEAVTADMTFGEAMKTLGDTLLNEIGGSMGPLYGSFFRKCAKTVKGSETIDAPLFSSMLHAGLDGVMEIGGAKEGDKTLVDCLAPSVRAFDAEFASSSDFVKALSAASEAAEQGKEATKGMMARVGRASRLGERSVGVLDAGSTSCCIILKTMYAAIVRELSR